MKTPESPYPPELSSLSDRVSTLPGVESSGLTMTPQGNWGVLVILTRDAPEREGTMITIRQWAGTIPVVFEDAEMELPVAYPAYPVRDR